MFTAVRVVGDSMLPALHPGDWLLVRRGGTITPGDIVVARRPAGSRWEARRDAPGEPSGVVPGEAPGGPPEGLIVKRAFRLTDEGWWLESDNQRAPGRRDSWDFGAVPSSQIVGRVVFRYWPRFGRAFRRCSGGRKGKLC